MGSPPSRTVTIATASGTVCEEPYEGPGVRYRIEAIAVGAYARIMWCSRRWRRLVNLFVDHSQIVELECLRSGIWGTKSLCGRVITYPA